jgi:hypothetical protein
MDVLLSIPVVLQGPSDYESGVFFVVMQGPLH